VCIAYARNDIHKTAGQASRLSMNYKKRAQFLSACGHAQAGIVPLRLNPNFFNSIHDTIYNMQKKVLIFYCILITDCRKLIDRRDACPPNFFIKIGQLVNWQIGQLENRRIGEL